MQRAIEVFRQNDGDVTKAYYADLNNLGPLGRIATALFRCQKRSTAAKSYRRGRYRASAYDVKSWSMGELCKCLAADAAHGITWGWKQDPNVLFDHGPAWVLYCDLPGIGQVSFHSPDRCGCGPDYRGEWDGQHKSQERVLVFCDRIAGQLVGVNA